MYKIFLDSNLNEEISIDQGVSSLLYGIEKILIKASQSEKEIQTLQVKRNELKREFMTQNGNQGKNITSESQKKIKKLTMISNIQVVFILAIITTIIMVFAH